MVACNLQEPRSPKLQNTAFLQTGCVLKSHKIFLQGLHGVSSTPLQFSATKQAGAKFKKWMSVLNWWSSTYDSNRIYIYILWNILCRFIESYAHSLASEPRMLPRIFCFHSLETKDQFKLPPNGQKGRLTTLDTTGSNEVRGTSKFFCCTCLSCLIGASGGLCLDFLLTETGEWPVPCSIESFMIWSESERCAVEALIGRLEWDIVSWL